MNDKIYSFLRNTFFWIFFLLFIGFTPILVYYSLGYKFDSNARKFLKTGILSVASIPKDVEIFLNNQKQSETTPWVVRGLLPGNYSLLLKRNGFYPYKVNVSIKPSQVTELDITLVPVMKDALKLKHPLNVIKFFMTGNLFRKKIIAFAEDGLYFIDENLEEAKKIASFQMGIEALQDIIDIKKMGERLLFWNSHNIWCVFPEENEGASVKMIYKTKEKIKDVFYGLKEKYIIVHDGMEILALDFENPEICFSVLSLNSISANIYYDSSSDELFVKDRVPSSDFSLFKLDLRKQFHEKEKE